MTEEQKQLIEAYYDNELSEAEANEAKKLINNNPDCRLYLEVLSQQSNFLRLWWKDKKKH